MKNGEHKSTLKGEIHLHGFRDKVLIARATDGETGCRCSGSPRNQSPRGKEGDNNQATKHGSCKCTGGAKPPRMSMGAATQNAEFLGIRIPGIPKDSGRRKLKKFGIP